MSHSDDSSNPYAPSASLAQGSVGALGVDDSKLVKDFRSQILALGVLWIIFGLLAIFVLVAVFGGLLGNSPQANNPQATFFAVIVGFVALGWLVSGVMALTKSIAGVYVGLVLSYISLVGNAIQLSICGIVILVVILIQAHRVIGFASKMRSRGIPINYKP